MDNLRPLPTSQRTSKGLRRLLGASPPPVRARRALRPLCGHLPSIPLLVTSHLRPNQWSRPKGVNYLLNAGALPLHPVLAKGQGAAQRASPLSCTPPDRLQAAPRRQEPAPPAVLARSVLALQAALRCGLRRLLDASPQPEKQSGIDKRKVFCSNVYTLTD